MNRKIFYFNRQMLPSLGLGSTALFAAGAALAMFGLTVLLVPQILVLMIAGAFLTAGSVVLGLAWKTRQLEQLTRRSNAELWDPPLDDQFDGRF